MADLPHVPPGRAGRLWLRHRLDVARRGVELLDHQLRFLRGEQERLRSLTAETGAAWSEACREAEQWLLRAAVVGDERDIRLATEPATAVLAIGFRSAMGIRYPDGADLSLPVPSLAARPAGNSGLVAATAAYQAAVRAAVLHASADTARRIVDAETDEVRRRRRAVSDRWIPRLEAALRERIQGLEETERDELVRLHWLAERRDGGLRRSGR